MVYGEKIDHDGNPLWCEQCGEAHQTTTLAEAGLCGVCFEETMRQELMPILGYRACCAPVWRADQPCLCLVESGIEHIHDVD
jgi:hypothetical protein